MADATERKQVPAVGSATTSLAKLTERKTPQLPNIVEVHGKVSQLTYTGTGFDSTTAT